MQLLDDPIIVKKCCLLLDLPIETSNVLVDTFGITRNDLVAGAVIAKRFTERNMHIQRKRTPGFVTHAGCLLVLLSRKGLIELQGCRIGRISRASSGIAFDQFRDETDVLRKRLGHSRICCVHGMDMLSEAAVNSNGYYPQCAIVGGNGLLP